MRKQTILSGLAVSVFTIVAASVASAVPITGGQSAVAVNENNPVGGTTIGTLFAPFATANYTGTLVTKVIQGDTSNTYGGLTFTYQVLNDASSANSLTRVTVNGFGNYATDMSYQNGTGTVIPIGMDRNNPDVAGFTFLGAPLGLGTISPGSSSQLLVVQTNASSFVTRIANISNGAVTSFTAYGPAGAITPEPATLVALGGASLLLGRRRRA